MAVTTLSRATDSALRRQVMIDSQLRPSDVTDPRVLSAIARIDRERFVPAGREAMAYADRAIPLDGARAMNPVLTTARMIVALAPRAGDHVLLIGAATGYAAAVLAAMQLRVTAVEEDPALLDQARTALADSEGVTLVHGPLAAGASVGAPYDALLIDGAVEDVPPALLHQLRDGAPIVTGMRDRSVTRIGRAVRVADVDSAGLLPIADMECVALPGFSAPPSFQF